MATQKRKLLILKDTDGEGPVSYISVPGDMMLEDARIKHWMRQAEVYADEVPVVFHADTLTDLLHVFKQDFPSHMRRVCGKCGFKRPEPQVTGAHRIPGSDETCFGEEG